MTPQTVIADCLPGYHHPIVGDHTDTSVCVPNPPQLPVPTLSEYGLAALIVMVVIGAFVEWRRTR